MIPFLHNVAYTYYKKYGSQISDFTFVFPNRRASIFFQHYLSQIADKPIFSPKVVTVSDLFEQLCPYKKADRVELLFLLYDIYIKQSASDETFDEFLYWGQMLLNDFDDADKYLSDPKQLFQNIYDLKQIDADFSFMTEEQVEAVRRFWSNFLPIGDNDKKKDFLATWQILLELYTTLRQQLIDRGLAYEGMIFRHVVEEILKDNYDKEAIAERIIFVGLNAHSKSEEKLLKYFHNKGIADFYWDYSSPLVRDPENKASYFIDKNKLQFPSRYPLLAEEKTMYKPKLEVVGIPSSVGQAKYVHQIVTNLLKAGEADTQEKSLNTAIVLPDENLLLPTLYSIPEEIDKINVTMGYNLSNSSIWGFVQHIADLQHNIRLSDGNVGFYYQPVLAILNHRYIINTTGSAAENVRKDILKYNKVIVNECELQLNELFKLVFKPIRQWYDIPQYIKDILAYIQLSLKVNPDEQTDMGKTTVSDIEREFIIEYYKCINRMQEVLKAVTIPSMSINTYFKLLKKIIAGVSVPFSGEPLSGLQIMGILETRGLDFDNVILLSMNEGIFPVKKAAGSFIPYNLRKGFELPTYEHQDAVFAYHFYRMISRAKRIFMLYDTRTEGLQTGEVSRYFNQIKYLYHDHFDIQEKLATYKVSASESLDISMPKSEEVMKKLKDFQTGGNRSLSASAINMYLNCPLQFYFSVVEQMSEEEDVSETIEASMFGTIFHAIMESIYKPFTGKMVTADLLHGIRANDKLLTEYIEHSFAEYYFKSGKIRKLTGQNYLTGEVLRKYIKQVLAVDAKQTPFIYIESEKRLTISYPLESGISISLKSFIDRVDEVKGYARIIDYKTGKGSLRFKSVAELFDKEVKDRPKAIMQVFMYAHLYMLENPQKVVQPAIYYLRNLFDPKFDPAVITSSRAEQKAIVDFSTFRNDFKTHFGACLNEIFDPTIPFVQTPTGEACKWCQFTNICKK